MQMSDGNVHDDGHNDDKKEHDFHEHIKIHAVSTTSLQSHVHAK